MKNKKVISFTLTIILMMICLKSFGQAPGIEWQNTIGGSSGDACIIGFQTSDGGYFIGGYSVSGISGDKTENDHGVVKGDYWVLKLDVGGNIIWQNTIGGSNTDVLCSAIETADGGYFLGGYSFSGLSVDKTEPVIGGNDYWVIKIDYAGNIEWQNTIGGTSKDNLYHVIQTADGGYLLGGYSESGISGDKTQSCVGGIFYGDYWIVKLNGSGFIEWDKTFGGEFLDELHSLVQTSDGGFLLGGTSNSEVSGNKTAPSHGGDDYWIIKINTMGEIEWQRSIGGNFGDYLQDVYQTSDGGFILGGYSNSDVSGDKSEPNHSATSYYDYWIVKTNNLGIVQWENTIGGTNNDEMFSIIQTLEGGYIAGGFSNSEISGDKTESALSFSKDFWIVKLDNFGVLEWQNTIGGNSNDMLTFISQTNDLGYFIGGSSNSDISGDKSENTFGLATDDFWIIKLFTDCTPSTEICNTFDDNCNGIIDDGITETISITAGGPISFCQGGSVLLTAIYSGASLQWKKNGTNIPGATTATYNVTTKGNYSCVTTSACGTAESTPIFVNVIKNPNASISAGGPTTFCAGGSVILTEIAVAGCTFQWYKAASPITGATSLTYTATTSGNYKCRVTKAATGCYKNSNAIAVSVPCREGENITKSNFSLYPNPANNFITIKTDFSTEKTISITDALGQIVKTITTFENNITIDLHGIAAGVYFIKMEDGFSSVTQKFVKQ